MEPVALLRDIAPGSIGYSSLLSEVTPRGERLFFVHMTSQLWVSNGTPATTKLIKRFGPDGAGNVSQLTPVGGRVFFSAQRASEGEALWVSDGTGAGTRQVMVFSGSLGWMLAAGDRLFFIGSDAFKDTLYVSDGTATGTQALLDAPFDSFSAPTVVGNRLYFLHDGALWRSDGTPDGTMLLGTLRNLRNLRVWGELLLLIQGVTLTTQRLLSSDVEGGRVQIIAAPPPSASDDAVRVGVVGVTKSLIFFTMNSRLWRSDGTAQGTYQLWDAGPGVLAYSNKVIGERLFFAGAFRNPWGDTSLPLDSEPWVSDGTQAGTRMLADLSVDDPYGSSPGGFALFGERVLFSAGGDAGGRELWSVPANVALPAQPARAYLPAVGR